MDTQISTLRDEAATAVTTAKTLRASLATLNTTMSTADLRTFIAAFEKEQAETETRLRALRAGNIKPVKKEEKEKVESELKVWKGVAERREKIAKEMWKMIEEVVQGADERAELRERLGLDE
jgi:26S proteasome regulatory subunit (ATPase 3-interacting protein)